MLKDNIHFHTIQSAYPHIAHKLEFFWGHPDFIQYVDKLTYDTRDGGRQGFPPAIFMALFSLSEDHLDAHPFLRVMAKKNF